MEKQMTFFIIIGNELDLILEIFQKPGNAMRSGTDLMPQNGLKVQLNSGHPTRLTDLINTHPFSSQTSRHQKKQIGLFGASIARSPARRRRIPESPRQFQNVSAPPCQLPIPFPKP